jgi:SAM-dependent methyltransferase
LRQSRVPLDPYGEIAAWYDAEHDAFTADLAMYQQIVEMVGDPVLELACGSGRILQAIAAPGRRLTGIDSSTAMIERCRRRFAGSPQMPDLIEGSMIGAMVPDGYFGVVIVGLSSLHHLITQHDQISALRTAYDALDPRGMLVLDLMNPFQALTTDDDGTVHLETTLSVDYGTLQKFSVRRTDLASQLITNQIWYDLIRKDSSVDRTATSMELRLTYPAELDLMLSSAGFVGSESYGTYDLDSFEPGSPRLIVMAEKSA